MIRIGVPTGRLWPQSRALLDALGFTLDETPTRRYVFDRPGADLQALTMKTPDVAAALGDGLLDLAVASDDWLAEHGCDVHSLVPLCWYHIRICLLIPQKTPHTVASPATIATPYPRLASRALGEMYSIRAIAGAAEAYPGHLTAAAVDCVETGATLLTNKLQVTRELMRGDVRLVARPFTNISDPVVHQVISAARDCAVNPECTYATSMKEVMPR